MSTKVEVITSESEHWYPSSKKKGTFYPSVTTILSVFPKGIGFNKYLVSQNSWEESQETLNKAGARGTLIHKATEDLERGETLQRDFYSLDVWQALMGFCNWHQKFSPKMIYTEESLVSDKLKTGGTVDRVYEIDGEYMVLDIKSSNAIHDNYYIQTSVYAKMIEEKFKITISKTAILRITGRRKEGYEYKIHERDEWQEDFKLFKPLQDIWNHMNPNAGPKELEVPTTLTINKTKNDN